MKPREVPEPPPVLPPPLELRRWDIAPQRIGPGERPGCEVFASREEWIAARAAWRSSAGDDLAQWWATVAAEARAEARVLEVLALKPEPDHVDQGW